MPLRCPGARALHGIAIRYAKRMPLEAFFICPIAAKRGAAPRLLIVFFYRKWRRYFGYSLTLACFVLTLLIISISFCRLPPSAVIAATRGLARGKRCHPVAYALSALRMALTHCPISEARP